jgi:alpha-glucosidase
MVDVEIPHEKAYDPQEFGKPGTGRDPERTPMQWDSGQHAGFTEGEPWLPVAPDYREYNVEAERDDPASMLALYRQLIALRKASPALSVGSYADVPSDALDVFSYMREHNGERVLVVLNFSHEPRIFKLAGVEGSAEVALSTVHGRGGLVELANVDLAPDEGIILRLT